MTLADALVDPAALALPWALPAVPVAAVRLDRAATGLAQPVLPPWPVLGIGDPGHPLAGALDLVVADEAAGEAIVANCRRRPQAAAVLVQLLRLIEHLPVADALVAESLAYGLLQGGAEHDAWLAGRAGSQPQPPGRLTVERQGNVLHLVLDRPQALNAIDRQLRDALRAAFELAALDPAIERIAWRATGRTFSIGADLAEFGTTRDPVTAHAIRMQTLPAPAIAACAGKLAVHIQGGCLGAGIEMAAFAARISCGPGAWFQLPELAMGLIPGAGGCVSLSRRIGRALTAWLVLSGRRIGARQALDWGLVDAIAGE